MADQNKKSPNHEVIRTRNMDSPTTVDEEPIFLLVQNGV